MNIETIYWQISLRGVGMIEEGVNDIRQCLDIILRTRKGTDPLRPTFGSNVFDWVDKPLTQAIPNIKREIIEAVGIWESRVKVERVQHEIAEDNISFQITYSLVEQELRDSVTFYLGDGFSSVVPDSGYTILTAGIPLNTPANKKLVIAFSCDGTPIPPYPPPYGFDTVDALYVWVQENWLSYGTWFITADRVVLYMKQGVCDNPSLSILVRGGYTFHDEFIIPDPGEYFAVTFIADGQLPGTLFPDNQIITKEELLTWITSNWAIYGDWSLDANKLILVTEKVNDAILIVHTSDTPLLYFDENIVVLDGDYVLLKH